MMNADLRQIRHVVTLGKLLSFTRAAQELGITQSALTRSIQAIEEKAKVRLFDRSRGGVRLTEVGRSYVKRGASLLKDAEELDRLLDGAASAEVGEVQFGVIPAITLTQMAKVLAKQLANRPQLRVGILMRPADRLIELLESDQIEFCICGERPNASASLKASVIGKFPLSLLVRAGHPLLDTSTMLDPRDFPLVYGGQFMQNWRIPEISGPHLLAPPQVTIDDIGFLANYTAMSDAIWITTELVVPDELQRGILKELPSPNIGKISDRMVLYSHRHRTLSPAARHLAGLLTKEVARWIASKGVN